MKIGFFVVSEPHVTFAKNLISSAARFMPGVEVWQLTDGECPALKGVHVMRLGGDMPMAVRRMRLHSQCAGEWLFVDSDIVFNADVRDVFDQKFEIALTDREGTITYEQAYAKIMPYNIGVVFSRCPEFWRLVLEQLYDLPPDLQHWTGDQMVVAEIMRNGLASGFRITTLPGWKYNYPPQGRDDPQCDKAAILHYKGKRKDWIRLVA